MIRPLRWPMQSSVGLDIQNRMLRVVELVKVFGTIRLRKFGAEPIEADPPTEDDVVRSIEQLFARLKIRSKGIVAPLDAAWIRFYDFERTKEEQSETMEWIRDQINIRLPSTIPGSQLSVTSHTMEVDSRLRCFTACCRNTVVEKRVGLLEHAGFDPVGLRAGRLDLFQPYVLDDVELLDLRVCFIEFDQGRTTTILTDGGIPVMYESEEGATLEQDLKSTGLGDSVRTTVLRCEEKLSCRMDRVILIGETLSGIDLSELNLEGRVIYVGSPLKTIKPGGHGLPSEYSAASGMAIQRFTPRLNTIDFLPESRRQSMRNALEKRWAQRFILCVGIFCLFVVLLLTMIKHRALHRLERLEESQHATREHLAQVESAMEEYEALTQRMENIRKLMVQRRSQSALMFELSRVGQRGLWLAALTCGVERVTSTDGSSADPTSVFLEGWSLDEGVVADYVEALEMSEWFRHVQLLSTSRASEQEVWRKTRLKRMPLVRFQITADLNDG